MAKKQFIRHLEYYGFPDQNQYSSDFTGVDLSDIREKNKEQDEEIDELEGEKANKSDLIALSREVDSLIDTQSEFNEEVTEKINSITSDIEKLKEIDNEYGEQLSALTDSVNDVIENVNELDERVDNIEENLADLSGKVENFSADTIDAIETLTTNLDDKLDKEEAEEVYAKKEYCVTRDYLDEKLEDYATKEWVEEQGYLTQEVGDERYAKKESLDSLSGLVESAVSSLDDKVNSISGDLQTLSSTTNDKIDTIETTLNSFGERITNNEESIESIEEDLAKKADKEDLEVLQTEFENLQETVAAKVDKDEFDAYKISVANKFESFDEKKADKSGLTAAMDAIDDVNDKLDQEIADRIASDEHLQTEIEALSGNVTTYDERIASVESGLAQEISDRMQADLDLIGHETDDQDDDTIWAAKNFAKNKKREAVAEAKEYTDDKATSINNRIDREHEWAEQNFSSAASKSYVETMVNNLETELEEEISNSVSVETQRATSAEYDLLIKILTNQRGISGNTASIDNLADRVNAITAWEGTDPETYVNTGNGVLDVLHREFHEFEENYGSIKEIKVVDDNLVITYYTKDGVKEVDIPITDLVDLTDYYTKEETDAQISGAIGDISAELDNKVDSSAFTETVEGLEERIEENSSAITSNAAILSNLIEKLGYTNNDTLNTTNEYEVAFGKYNVSNTGDEPSNKTIFSIGNGTDDSNRSNALEIREDGTVYLWIEGEYMNINVLLGMLAHETY